MVDNELVNRAYTSAGLSWDNGSNTYTLKNGMIHRSSVQFKYFYLSPVPTTFIKIFYPSYRSSAVSYYILSIGVKNISWVITSLSDALSTSTISVQSSRYQSYGNGYRIRYDSGTSHICSVCLFTQTDISGSISISDDYTIYGDRFTLFEWL